MARKNQGLLIGTLREAPSTVAGISAMVVVAFTMLILAPTAQAVQVELNRPVSEPPSAEAQFATQMSELSERVKQWRKALDSETGAPPSEATRGRRDLRLYRARLATLDPVVRKGFHDLQRDLDERQLPAVLRDRHREMVTHYEDSYAELGRLLDDLSAARGSEEIAALEALVAFLDEHPAERHQRPFDPTDLPFQNLRPVPHNQPRESTAEFQAAESAGEKTERISASVQASTLDASAASAAPGSSASLPAAFADPVFRSETDEVVLTEAIRAKAAELEHDPVKIYHWVRNNIDWLPTWGAQQDAVVTLGSRRGNALDQASLLIALLRASDIPARYVHGTIEVDAETFRNWSGGFADIAAAQNFAASGGIPVTGIVAGGQVQTVRLEHVWVEAGLDYQPSRGAKHITPDSWEPMDPSFKRYEFLPGLDPIAISGLDSEQIAESFVASGTVNAQESWVTGFDPTILHDAQQQIQLQLEQFIQDRLQNPTVGEVIGGRKVIVQEFPIVPASLPYKVLVAGARHASLPAVLQQRLTLAFEASRDGFPIDPVVLPWARVNNHKLTLSFSPASAADAEALAALIPEDADSLDDLPRSIPSLIRVVPELRLDGEVLAIGTTGLPLGTELRLFNEVFFPGRGPLARPLSVIAGAYMALGAESGGISPDALRQLQAKVEQTKTALETEDPTFLATLGREDILGDLFHAGMLGYYAQYTALSQLMGLQQGGHVSLMAGLGTFGYEPKVVTLFGFPRSITLGGVALDIPIVGVQVADGSDPTAQRQFTMQVGLLSSALEHAVPEQMFGTAEQPADAISAVKALSKANAQGQRIYHLTPANRSTTFQNLNLAFETEQEISQALSVGKEVIAHTDSVSVPGWSGAGYVIFDPVTGEGAYKISGGANGGFLSFLLGFFQTLVILFITSSGLALVASVAALAGTLILTAAALGDAEASLEVAGLRLVGALGSLTIFLILGEFAFISLPLIFVMGLIVAAISVLVNLTRVLLRA